MRIAKCTFVMTVLMASCLCSNAVRAQTGRWTEQKANPHPDGTPYRQAEVDLIRRLTGKQ